MHTTCLILMSGLLTPGQNGDMPDPTTFQLILNAKIDPNPGGVGRANMTGLTRVSFSKDATLLCVNGYLFNLASLQAAGRIMVDGWNTAVLSPDGTSVAVTYDNWQLWKIPKEQLPGGKKFNFQGIQPAAEDQVTFDPAPKRVGSLAVVAFSNDGKWLGGGGPDGTLGVWDVARGKLKSSARASRYVDGLAFDAEAKRLMAWSANGVESPVVWDLADSFAEALPDPFAGQRYRSKQVVMDPTGKRAAEMVWSAGKDGLPHLILWNQSQETQVVPLPEVVAVAPSPDGQTLALATPNGNIGVSPKGLVGRPKLLMTEAALGGERGISALQFSPGGRYLVAVINNERVLVFGPATPAKGLDGFEEWFPTVPGSTWNYRQKHHQSPEYEIQRYVQSEQIVQNYRCVPILTRTRQAYCGDGANEYWTVTEEGLKLVTPSRLERVLSTLVNAQPIRPGNAPLLVIPAAGSPRTWRTEIGRPEQSKFLECVAEELMVNTPIGKRPGIKVTMKEVDAKEVPEVFVWVFAQGVGLVRHQASSSMGDFQTELTSFQPGRGGRETNPRENPAPKRPKR